MCLKFTDKALMWDFIEWHLIWWMDWVRAIWWMLKSHKVKGQANKIAQLYWMKLGIFAMCSSSCDILLGSTLHHLSQYSSDTGSWTCWIQRWCHNFNWMLWVAVSVLAQWKYGQVTIQIENWKNFSTPVVNQCCRQWRWCHILDLK